MAVSARPLGQLESNAPFGLCQLPIQSVGFKFKSPSVLSVENVGWVEAHSAETHRLRRWVSLTLNPFYPVAAMVPRA